MPNIYTQSAKQGNCYIIHYVQSRDTTFIEQYTTTVIIDDEAEIEWGDYKIRFTVSSELFSQLLSEKSKSRQLLVRL